MTRGPRMIRMVKGSGVVGDPVQSVPKTGAHRSTSARRLASSQAAATLAVISAAPGGSVAEAAEAEGGRDGPAAGGPGRPSLGAACGRAGGG